LLLLAGAVLGPAGANVLQDSAILLIAPMVPLALATIGLTLMLGPSRRVLLLEAAIALITILPLLPDALTGLDVAAASSVGWRALAAAAASALVGIAGVLLLVRRESATERRVLGLSVLLLLGGIGDFLGMPALLGGVIGGALWRRFMPTAAAVQKDATYLQNPLVALILLLAGAQVTISALVGGLAALHLLAAWLVRRRRSALPLPGAISVAIAMDVARSGGAFLEPIVSAVVLSVIVWQLLIALSSRPRALAGDGVLA
jgi:hypothetical protein